MVQSYKNESKSQHLSLLVTRHYCCDVWYKVTKMRANHNTAVAGYYGITLWCMVQSYKNESKSQLKQSLKYWVAAVMYGTKLQKWEQITTRWMECSYTTQLWCMVQSYKNESKSQLLKLKVSRSISCDVWYKVTKMRANHNLISRFKKLTRAVMYGTKLQKWEQITTRLYNALIVRKLWCMVQSYKNESKSQQYL